MNTNRERSAQMLIGCPKEIKPQEFRVGLTPNAAGEAIARGHKVIVETNAGIGAGFSDDDYRAIGAEVLGTAEEIFAKAEMIVKVKEPQAAERKMLREGQLLLPICTWPRIPNRPRTCWPLAVPRLPMRP
jgi:alanine dehydrogenase